MRVLALLISAHLYLGLVAAAPLLVVEGTKSVSADSYSPKNTKRDAIVNTVVETSGLSRTTSKIPHERIQFMILFRHVKDDYLSEFEQVLSGKGGAVPMEAQARAVKSGHNTLHNEGSPSTALARVKQYPPVFGNMYTGKHGYNSELALPLDETSLRVHSGASATFPSILTKTGITSPQLAPKVEQSKYVPEAEVKTKAGYLRDPKNAPKIVAASAVSVVATYMLGHQIKSNVDTTQQLNENAARINAQQQEESARALAQPVFSAGKSSATTTLAHYDAPTEQQGQFRIQKREQDKHTVAITKRGTPNPAGIFVAGVLGFAFYRGASEIEKQRAHDRYITMNEQEYGTRETTASSSTADQPTWKKPLSLID